MFTLHYLSLSLSQSFFHFVFSLSLYISIAFPPSPCLCILISLLDVFHLSLSLSLYLPLPLPLPLPLSLSASLLLPLYLYLFSYPSLSIYIYTYTYIYISSLSLSFSIFLLSASVSLAYKNAWHHFSRFGTTFVALRNAIQPPKAIATARSMLLNHHLLATSPTCLECAVVHIQTLRCKCRERRHQNKTAPQTPPKSAGRNPVPPPPGAYAMTTHFRAKLKVMDLRWRSPICGFLRFSVKILGFLRKSAVLCGLLHPPNAGISRRRGESAKISGFLRKSAFWVLSVTLVPSP